MALVSGAYFVLGTVAGLALTVPRFVAMLLILIIGATLLGPHLNLSHTSSFLCALIIPQLGYAAGLWISAHQRSNPHR